MKIHKPNGLISWIETFYEMAVITHHEFDKANSMAASYEEITDGQFELVEAFNRDGRCAIKDLAIKWTNEFEKLHKGREWDGEFWDAVDEFVQNKLTDKDEEE